MTTGHIRAAGHDPKPSIHHTRRRTPVPHFLGISARLREVFYQEPRSAHECVPDAKLRARAEFPGIVLTRFAMPQLSWCVRTSQAIFDFGMFMVTKLSPGKFFGQMQRSIEVGGLTFAESVYAAGSEPLHSRRTHENAFFYLVVEGVCEEVYGTKMRSCGQSSLVFHPAGQSHSNRWPSTGGRAFHIEISPARADAIRACADPGQSGRIPGRVGALACHATLPGIPAASTTSLPSPWRGWRSRSWPKRPEMELEPRNACPLGGYSGARELLHDRFAENPSIDDIASAVGIHPVHLARVFRRQYACTPGDYLRRLRIEFACKRLASSDTTLIEIALSAGFSDQSHFTRNLRRQQMWMTPGEFRRHFRSRQTYTTECFCDARRRHSLVLRLVPWWTWSTGRSDPSRREYPRRPERTPWPPEKGWSVSMRSTLLFQRSSF